MGMLVAGQWQVDDLRRSDAQGRFVRAETAFRDWVSADGHTGFPAQAGRYHLYISLACPWAHRTLIMRQLKGLQAAVGLSIVDWLLTADGWHFSQAPGAIPDSVNGAKFLREIYLKARPDYTGRVSVPVLWDQERGTIVNNESREILRMLDLEFDACASDRTSYAPPELRAQVDAMISANYETINNGVYRCGFARSQQAYDEAVTALFARLDECERLLARQRYLCGPRLTEADWCLFTTLVRFDAVYVTHFKCNLRRIADYPQLGNYLRDLYQVPGVKETVDFAHIKNHYFQSHTSINPTRIVPRGFLLDLYAPHDRQRAYGSG
ncbi:MAG TPA: glutathione S-transferase family protein [bacterium]|nr:glutathione S-transferase family protein [bacterium]